MNKFILDVDFNQFENRKFGWYIYAYIERDDGIISEFRTDTSISAKLLISVEKYREILLANGYTRLANNRTCFESKDIAKSIIPLLEKLVNEKLIF